MSSLISLYEQLMIYQLLMLQDEYVKEHLLLSYLSGIASLLFPLGQHKSLFTNQTKDKTKKLPSNTELLHSTFIIILVAP